MAGSITFQSGPFKGWQVQQDARWEDGRVVHSTVQIGTPYGREHKSGLLGFSPGIDGYHQALAAELHGGPAAYAALLEWIVEATAVALDRGVDRPADQVVYWQDVVDQADHARAEFFALYPDGTEPAFQVVAELAYEVASGQLVAA